MHSENGSARSGSRSRGSVRVKVQSRLVVLFSVLSLSLLGGSLHARQVMSLAIQSAALLTPGISVTPDSLTDSLLSGDTATHTLTISNTGSSDLTFDIEIERVNAGAAVPVDVGVFPRAVQASSAKELAAIESRMRQRSSARLDDTSVDDKDESSVPELGRVSQRTSAAALGGGLLPVAELIATFPDYSGNSAPMSIAFDGTYYWVVGGGYSYGEVAQLASDFSLVTTRDVNIDCRSVFYNPADGEVYIKGYSSNGLFRLHTDPFDGTFDMVFSNLYQDSQSKVCISPDGQYMFDHYYGTVRQYEFATGTLVNTISLDLQHDSSWPRGFVLAHTGDYLLTLAAGTVYAYDPANGNFVASSTFPGALSFEEWSLSYTNGLCFCTNAAEDTWYAFSIDGGVGPAWLVLDQESGSIQAGGSMNIGVMFDATGLLGGDYYANVLITSNDPISSEVTVPAHLKVTGIPDIAVSLDTLDFGDVYTVDPQTQPLLISNMGTEVLTVTAISSDVSEFSGDITAFELAPEEDTVLNVTFSPVVRGELWGSLSISSDDPDEAVLTVTLRGFGRLCPDLAVSPDSLIDSVFTGQTSNDSLFIKNIGPDVLEFSFPAFASAVLLNDPLIQKNNTAHDFGFLEVAKGESDPRLGNPVVLGAGGPDNFGYSWIDSDELDGPAFDFIDITSTGTHVSGLYDDNRVGPFSIGFSFPFYDSSYSEFYIQSNGVINFDSRYITLSNQPIPQTDAYNNLLAWCWDDLYGHVGHVYYQQLGNKLVIQFVGYGQYYTYGTVDAEVIIYDNGNILFQYERFNNGFYTMACTVGMENADGTDGLEVAFNTSYLHDGLAIMFSRKPAWVTQIAPVSGVVGSADSLLVEVTFSGADMLGGDYTDSLEIQSNDCDDPAIYVPARLHVTGASDIEASPDTLVFGVVYVGYPQMLPLLISNGGTDVLSVTGIESDVGGFSVDITSFDLPVGEDTVVHVTFSPADSGDVQSHLSISSNDPDESVLAVTLKASGRFCPDWAVSPDSLIDSLFTGEIAFDTLYVKNTGFDTLRFSFPMFAAAAMMSKSIDKDDEIYGTLASKLSVDETPVFGSGDPVVLDAGGPDNFGYAWIDSDEPGGPIFSFVDITSTGTPVTGLIVNNRVGPLPIGFAFPFYGNSYTEFYVQSNGLISFGSGYITPVNQPIPQSDSYNNLLAWCWDDLNGLVGDVYYQQLGNKLVIQFVEYGEFAASGTVNAEVIIFENGNILFQYDSFNNGFHRWHSTVGIENADGTDGLQVAFNTDYLHDGLALMFARWPAWMWATEASPSSGSVASGDSLPVQFTLSGFRIPGGDYLDSLLISSNDCDEPLAFAPARIHVTSAPDIYTHGDSLNYGVIFVGVSATDTLVISNVGTELLTVTDISSDISDYSVDATSFSVNPGEFRLLLVTFAPTTVGPITSNLTISSNDPDEAAVVVTLKGEGLMPPIISVTPDSLSDSLYSGDTATHSLSIVNNGGSDLHFELSMFNLGSGLPAASQVTLGKRSSVSPGRTALTLSPDETPGEPVDYVPGEPKDITSGIMFNDNFEDGNFDGWLDHGGYGIKEVTNATAARGTNYSYHEYSSPYGHFDGIYHDLGGIQPSYISFYVRSGSSSTADGYFVLRHGSGYEGIFFFTRSNGYLYANDNVGGDNTYPYVSETWYHIEFKNIDFDMKTFDYYVDETLVEPGIPFRYPGIVTDFDRLEIYNFNSGSEAWWDEIVIAGEEVADWISAEVTSGTVPAAGRMDIAVMFDATNLFGGDYFANVVITSNDSSNQEVIVPAHLNVTGIPDIVVSRDSLDFEEVYTNDPQTQSVVISNMGTDVLTVTGIVSDVDEFSAEIAAFALAPGADTVLNVTFSPVERGELWGSLSISSDDPDEPIVTISLRGFGRLCPYLAVSPDSLVDTVFVEETVVDTLCLKNIGLDTLEFSFPDFAAAALLNDPLIQKNETAHGFGFLEVAKGESDPRIGNPVVLGAGGPDNFGYTWIDSDEPGGPEFDFVDITSTGIFVGGLADDNYVGPFPIGFSFPFYDNSYTAFYIQSNGVINFDNEYITLSNQPIPQADGFDNLLAWCWDDLYGFVGDVFYQQFGDRLVIQFVGYGQYYTYGTVDAEVVIFDNGNILFRYERFNNGFYTEECTVGIENADGTDGLLVAFNTAYLHDKLAILFSRLPDWISEISPVTGLIGSEDSLLVEVTISGVDMPAGDYTDHLEIQSNDCDDSQALVAVYLRVYEYLCGDADGSRAVDLADIQYVRDFYFEHGSIPAPLNAGDANCDGAVNIGDIIYLADYLFRDGNLPCCP